MSSEYRIVDANHVEDFIAKKSRFVNQCLQLDKGPFWAKTEILYHSDINISRRTTQRTILECGRWPTNLRCFTFHSTDANYFRNGVLYANGDISATERGDAYISVITAGCHYHALVVNDQFAKKMLDKSEWRGFEQLNETARTVLLRSKVQPVPIIEQLDQVMDDLAAGTLNDRDNQAIGDIHQQLLKNITILIRESGIEKLRANANYRLVYKACKIVLGIRTKTITVEELASKVATSRRNLEHVFQSSLGISPKQFMLSVRLNRVRKDLLTARNVSASSVAKRLGFSHIGHFSKAYKTLFNELPSETRGRAAALAV